MLQYMYRHLLAATEVCLSVCGCSVAYMHAWLHCLRPPMFQDPMGALQSMAKVSGANPGAAPIMAGPMGQPGMGGPQMVQGAPGMMQPRTPFQNYQAGPSHRGMSPAGMHVSRPGRLHFSQQ